MTVVHPQTLELAPVGDPKSLFATFAQFPSGVAALSALVDGEAGPEPVVLVASSFQVGISADPPLVLFAVQHTSTSWPRLRTALQRPGALLGVSVLGEAHDAAARQLACKALTAADRFAGIATTTTASGAHFVHGAPIWLECSIHSQVRAGDHDVVLLQVHTAASAPGTEPLVWHSSAFRTLTPRTAAGEEAQG
ncbi:flavin reductase family protein [Kineococcus sp. SYSU DK018]|uniref:flavin reductase family protein n=1 Tax=Kineococcus sp. SYSU DK018 TaxID=3383139 RepID=UPI003D7CBFE8